MKYQPGQHVTPYDTIRIVLKTWKKTNASTFLYTQLVTWDHLKHENSQSKNRQTFIRILKLKCVILLYKKKKKKSQCSKLGVLGGGQPNIFFFHA